MSDNPNPGSEAAAGPKPADQPDYSNNALHKKAGGDWNKASESYFNAVTELGKVHETLNAERTAKAQLEAMVMAAAGGKAPGNQASPFAELESLGISSEAIEQALEAKANAIVDSKIGTLFNPIVAQIEAEEKLASEIENFDQHKSEARKFMKKDDEHSKEVGEVFKALVQTNPVAAWKYAIRETLIDKQAKVTRSLPAGLPSGRTPAGRGAPETVLSADHQQREAEAATYLQKFGDSGPYLNERFKGTSVERAVQNAMRQIGYDPDNQ